MATETIRPNKTGEGISIEMEEVGGLGSGSLIPPG